MAMTMRASSMLPAIKCSNCGNDVEISMMGEHVCAGSGHKDDTDSSDSSRAFPYPPAQRVDSAQLLSPDGVRQQLKPAKFVPPSIDPHAANRPYAPRDASTPTNAWSPDTNSPNSPFLTHRQIHGHKGLSPREPSGELSSNLDCAFPPFPASPLVSTPRSDTSSPGFFSDPNPFALSANPKPAPTPVPAPAPARSAIPLPRQPQQSQHERDEAKRDAFFGRKRCDTAKAPQTDAVNGTFHGNSQVPRANTVPVIRKPVGEAFRTEPQPTAASYSKAPPPRPSRPGGEIDDFIATLKEHAPRLQTSSPPPMGMGARSHAFPDQPAHDRPGRRPSEPPRLAIRTAQDLPERAATTNDLRNPYAPDANVTLPPPRSSSRTGLRPAPRGQHVPPIPSTHVSSPSTSSAASSVSAAGSDGRTGCTTPFSEVSTASWRSPPKGGRQAPGLGQLTASPEAYPHENYETSMAAKPAKHNMASPPRADERPLPAPPQDSSAAPRSLTRTDTSGSLTSQPSTSKPRHTCRGCREPIIGKSIQSADGRLTGRYHRGCFACTTCRAPFAEAQVYVLEDQPYCAHHYHVLNGSLCRGCDRGIEGQYLETERGEKHHPRCLCCKVCRAPLGGEYFDVKGNMYCERHALAEVRRLGAQQSLPGTGGLTVNAKAERRITRIGMFM